MLFPRFTSILLALTLFSVSLSAQEFLFERGDYLEWYLPTSDSFNLYVEEYGRGDTVIVLHGGWGAEHSYLQYPLAAHKENHHFVFYDQRGSLRSPCPDSLISIDKHIEDLELLRTTLDLDKVTLLGHSMGSWLASAYLHRYPERVEKMVLLSLPYPKSSYTPGEEEVKGQQNAAVKRFFEREAIQQMQEELGLAGGPLSPQQSTIRWRVSFAGANIYHIERWKQMRGGQAFYSQAAGSAAGRTFPESWNFLETYREVDTPIAVIAGSHDFVDFGGRLYPGWFEPLENVRYHLVDKAGHNVWIDAPEVFGRLLRENL